MIAARIPAMSAVALSSRRYLRSAATAVLIAFTAAVNTGAQPPAARQVLVLQSMDRGSLVFDSFTSSFRASLQERAGTQLTLFEFVVAPAGLTEAPDAPVIDFLHSIYAGRQPPELIVTVGGPAAAFARRHRAQLFPRAAMLLAAVETRYLGSEALAQSETSVTVSIDYTTLIDDILQLLPETRQVFMITGSGPLSRFWRTELERSFERYRNRLAFIWSQDLTYDQMLERASALPPHSIIFYISSGTFATGSWQGEERTLADLETRANAPVFGAQGAWLGAGLVGGRLLHTDDLGVITAGVVMRILNGETPGGSPNAGPVFPPRRMPVPRAQR